jgi:hypothetical protein
MLLGLVVCSPALAAEPTESELKSVFLFNFTQFVDWPESSFSEPRSSFNLCILGEDPFGKTLDEVISNESVKGHPIVVRRFKEPGESDGCHILYVSPEMMPAIRSRHMPSSDSPTLTVSDIPEFPEHGGMIALHVVNRRLRVRINLAAARAAHLTISSKLLRLSEVIGEN